MHHLIQSNGIFRKLATCAVGAALLGVMATADAGAPAGAPQVMIAITNSQSMDGTTAGAIMVGSGSLGSDNSMLTSSSSPTYYNLSDSPGFTPPVYNPTSGTIPWTVGCTSAGVYDSSASPKYLCDNGPSRMNMTKAAIQSVLKTYASTINFGMYDYSVSAGSANSTFVYYMSPTGSNFSFTNTASTSPRTIPNPCYGYSGVASSVSTACSLIAGQYATGAVNGNMYMVIGTSSDDPLIVDVLYTGVNSVTPVDLNYGGVNPANPYAAYTIGTYNCCYSTSFSEAYAKALPTKGPGGSPQNFSTTPTNAGYVPFSPQVLYSARGFGYFGSSESATDGNRVADMNTDPTSSKFTTALQPETNSGSTGEIKSAAPQSATYGLLTGVYNYLKTLTSSLAKCQSQSVILLTDGLPTLDGGVVTSKPQFWPPLGTTTAINYNLTASYDSTGAFLSSNSQAVTDAISAIKTLSKNGIKVYVIGLGAGVDATVNPEAKKLLTAMAIAGGTNAFYPANSSVSLTAAFATITEFIYTSSAEAAPVAPISVAGGTSFEYELTSIATPGAGHVKAYPVAASGVASTVSSWDAGDSTHMSTATRTTSLMSTNASGNVVALGSVDAAAFNLTPTTCVPNVSKIVAYTIDPTVAVPSGCSVPYIGTRQAGWPLGVFSTQNTGLFMGPPQSASLAAHYSSYAAYARKLSSRTPSVLFTDSDGFLYSINASSGLMQWGWTSRNIAAQLQTYSTFAASGWTNGNFTVVDAMDSSGSWGSYLVGSFQSGAEHFSVALDSSGGTTSGNPTSVIYDSVVSGGTSAGDLAGKTGTTPLRQPTVVVYIGNVAYQVYVVSTTSGTTTTSTLYEQNVTSGVVTAGASLGFQVTSAISLDAGSNRLWMGGADGTVRYVQLSGIAATDASTLTTIGTIPTPPATTALANVLYVSYVEVSGIPYVWVANSAQITSFGINSTGWVPLWAATPSGGYVYNTTTAKWTASTTVTAMTASSVVSDWPLQVGVALQVPVFAASTATCPPGAGSGSYDFFNITDGSFPTTKLTFNGANVTSDIYLGDNSGAAYTPSLTAIAGGIALNTGSKNNTNPPNAPIQNLGGLGPRAISWTQH